MLLNKATVHSLWITAILIQANIFWSLRLFCTWRSLLSHQGCSHTPRNELTQGVIHHLSPESLTLPALTPLPTILAPGPALVSLFKAPPRSAQLHIFDLAPLSLPWHLVWTTPSGQITDTKNSACDQVLPWDSLHRDKHTSSGDTSAARGDDLHPAEAFLWMRRWGKRGTRDSSDVSSRVWEALWVVSHEWKLLTLLWEYDAINETFTHLPKCVHSHLITSTYNPKWSRTLWCPTMNCTERCFMCLLIWCNMKHIAPR